jgi:hypothetical protein
MKVAGFGANDACSALMMRQILEILFGVLHGCIGIVLTPAQSVPRSASFLFIYFA